MDVLQKWINNSNEMAQSVYDGEKDRLANELLFLEQIPESRELHEIAIRKRELGMKKVIEEQILGGFVAREQGSIWKDAYQELYDKAVEKYNWDILEEKQYNIAVKDKDGKTINTLISGGEIVKRMNKIYTAEAELMKKWIAGEGDGWRAQLKDYAIKDKDGKIVDWYNKDIPIIDVDKFVKDIVKEYRENNSIPMKYGMDGLRKVAYSLMLQSAEKQKTVDADLLAKMKKIRVEDTKFLPTDVYWPHMMFDKKKASESLKAGVTAIEKNPEMKPEAKEKEIMKLILQHKSMTGEWMEKDITDWQMFDGAMVAVSYTHLRAHETREDRGCQRMGL